jgi:hypothetical protein
MQFIFVHALSTIAGLTIFVVCAMTALAQAQTQPVQSGAMEICTAVDGGTVTNFPEGKRCCATQKGGTSNGRRYCVQCAASDPNNCALWYESARPTDTKQTWWNDLAGRLPKDKQFPITKAPPPGTRNR